MADHSSHYDIIGDIHGQAGKLEALLRVMGYAVEDGVWRHPSRTVIFVGDFVDRGPGQIETYRLVRAMTDAGTALAVMGNHEFNAIAWSIPDGAGDFLRRHSCKNKGQHQVFLDAIAGDAALYAEMIDWWLDLPLWLDLPGLRIVHACWHAPMMLDLSPRLRSGNRLSRDLMVACSTPGQPEYRAIETLLKGVEAELPDGCYFLDKDGNRRTAVRVRWWDETATTFRTAALLPQDEALALPDTSLPAGALCGYDSDKPLFIGHYWLTGAPALLAPIIACVDYSAGNRGPLVGYRWSGEASLNVSNFVSAG